MLLPSFPAHSTSKLFPLEKRHSNNNLPICRNAHHKCNYKCSSLALAFRKSFKAPTPATRFSSFSIPQFTSSPLNIENFSYSLCQLFVDAEKKATRRNCHDGNWHLCPLTKRSPTKLVVPKSSHQVWHFAILRFTLNPPRCLLTTAHLTRKNFSVYKTGSSSANKRKLMSTQRKKALTDEHPEYLLSPSSLVRTLSSVVLVE